VFNASPIAAAGRWGKVVWAGVPPGSIPQAYAFYLGLDDGDKAKVLTLFKRLADFGTQFHNREKFRALGEDYGPAGRDLFEFKSFQIRFLGDFRPGCLFIIASGMRKKKDHHEKSDLDSARKILIEYDALYSVTGKTR
jgi:hypothetical protein